MDNLPTKNTSIEEVLAAITSFNDANIVTSIFHQLGWDCSQEILETLSVARQHINLGAKMTAIKHLRKLLQESAEASGISAKVSKTIPGQDGEFTTFSARRMIQSLNPTKEVKSTIVNKEEKTDDRKKEEPKAIGGGSPETEDKRGSDEGNKESSIGHESRKEIEGRSESSSYSGADAGRDTPTGDERGKSGGQIEDWESNGRTNDGDTEQQTSDDSSYKPCIKHRPPASGDNLFPGVCGDDETSSK
jgi:hypothetical protein